MQPIQLFFKTYKFNETFQIFSFLRKLEDYDFRYEINYELEVKIISSFESDFKEFDKIYNEIINR